MVRNFQQLRELEILVTRPNYYHKVTLSSLTSTKFRKVSFLVWYMHNSRVFAQKMEEWGLIDKQLCGLADRLRAMGCCRTLEAELRLTKVRDSPGKYDFTQFLPEFREKGIVTIIDAAHGDRLLHSSVYP